jgi:RNA polymerase sigma-70 factor, ECF subfamily
MADPSRQELLRNWREHRTPESLGELLKAQRDRAYSIALRLTASPADAEDAVQDAFVKLMSRRKGFENLEQFDVSVYRAVVQCSLDAQRSERRRAAREDRAGREAAALAAKPAGAESHMSEGEMRELRIRLRSAVAELPEQQRAPAVLCYYQGLSEARAAEVLEVPRTTLRRRLSEAMDKLRSRVGKEAGLPAVGLLFAAMNGECALQAPTSLCRALDAALPGRPCTEIPALPASAATPITSGTLLPALGVAVAGLLAAAALLVGIVTALGPKPESAATPNSMNVTETPVSAVDVGKDAKQEEEPVMKKKMAGLGLVVGGLLFSGAAGATEPNAKVAGVIAQIRARQVAKAEALQKDAADRAKAYAKYGEGYRQ